LGFTISCSAIAMTDDRQLNSSEKLDILIDQVGLLTEGLTEIKLLIQQQTETSQKQAEMIGELAESVKQQRQSIDRLADVVEATNKSQSEAIKQLVGIVNKLIQERA
jgi:methyl-accepting chemotaxis protein